MSDNIKRNKEIIHLYTQSGMTAPEIAKKMNLGSTTVYRVLHKNGIEPKNYKKHGNNKGNRKFNIETEQKILKEYNSGKSSITLSQEYDVNYVTILNIIKRHGGKVKTVGGQYKSFSEKEIQIILDMYNAGASQEAIAELFKASQSRISRTLRKFGVYKNGNRHGPRKTGKISIGHYTYVLLDPNHKFHSMANSQSYIAEHRLVMAEHLGRPLEKHETVHHIDGNRKNNKLNNLQLRSGQHGSGVSCKCRNCGSTNIKFVKLN